jgi:hypothetical protein
MSVTMTTDRTPSGIVAAWALTAAQRSEFDYVDGARCASMPRSVS